MIDWGIAKWFAEDNPDICGSKWINGQDDYQVANCELAASFYWLEEQGKEIPKGWEKHYYKKRWAFVTACFTEHGCEKYLRVNGHNLRNPRIYVDSGYRNDEWIQLRKILSDGSLLEDEKS